MTDFPLFTVAADCPKCWHDVIGVRYVPPGCSDPNCTRCAGEHLRRTCARCGYGWDERVRDA